MTFDWDEAKAAANFRKHGVAFAKAYGFIGSALHVMVYVERGAVLRVVSLRRATRQEKRAYEGYIEKGW